MKAFIPEMARYKLNAIHLHLVDDQAWRIETTSLEDFDPGADGRVADERNQDKRLRAKNTPAKAGMQHIITRIKNPT